MRLCGSCVLVLPQHLRLPSPGACLARLLTELGLRADKSGAGSGDGGPGRRLYRAGKAEHYAGNEFVLDLDVIPDLQYQLWTRRPRARGLGLGWIEAGMEFRLELVPAGTVLSTETRVLATDPKTRRAFAGYWFVIRPGSSAIRREVLKVVARRAESSTTAR